MRDDHATGKSLPPGKMYQEGELGARLATLLPAPASASGVYQWCW
jgi:hypothetical protein